MPDLVALCRAVLADSTHPLYAVAWLVFAEKLSFKAADAILSERKAQVIPFLLDLLETPELYEETSLGAGWAPVHAVELLGHWKVIEAVPSLLRILEKDDWMSLVHDRSLVALEQMGPEIVEKLLPMAQQATDAQLRRTLATVLSEVGQGHAQVYAYIRSVLDEQRREEDVADVADSLLRCNLEAATSLLQTNMQNHRYTKRLQQTLERCIRDAQEDQASASRPA